MSSVLPHRIRLAAVFLRKINSKTHPIERGTKFEDCEATSSLTQLPRVVHRPRRTRKFLPSFFQKAGRIF